MNSKVICSLLVGALISVNIFAMDGKGNGKKRSAEKKTSRSPSAAPVTYTTDTTSASSTTSSTNSTSSVSDAQLSLERNVHNSIEPFEKEEKEEKILPYFDFNYEQMEATISLIKAALWYGEDAVRIYRRVLEWPDVHYHSSVVVNLGGPSNEIIYVANGICRKEAIDVNLQFHKNELAAQKRLCFLISKVLNASFGTFTLEDRQKALLDLSSFTEFNVEETSIALASDSNNSTSSSKLKLELSLVREECSKIFQLVAECYGYLESPNSIQDRSEIASRIQHLISCFDMRNRLKALNALMQEYVSTAEKEFEGAQKLIHEVSKERNQG